MVEAAQINDSIAAALLGDELDHPVSSTQPTLRSRLPGLFSKPDAKVPETRPVRQPVQRPRTPSPPARRRLRELAEQAPASISRILQGADPKQHQQPQKAAGSKISSLLEKADRIVKPVYRAVGSSAASAPATPAPASSRAPQGLSNRPKQPPGPPPGHKGSIAASRPKPPAGPPPGFKPAASSPGAAKPRPQLRSPGVRAPGSVGNVPQTPKQPGHPPPNVKKPVVSSTIPAPKTPPQQHRRPLQVTKIAKASLAGRAISGRPQQKGLPPMPPTGASNPPAGVKRPRPPQGYSRLQASSVKARRVEEHVETSAAELDDDEEEVVVEEDELVEDAEFERLRQKAVNKRATAGNVPPWQRPNGQQASVTTRYATAATKQFDHLTASDHAKAPASEVMAGASAAGASEVGGKVQELIGKGVALDADALGALFGAPTGVACAVLADLDNKKVNFANASKFVTTAVLRRTAVLASASRSPRM